MIPFSLMWGGFSFFWEYKAVSSGGPLFFDLWGVPFVLIGLYMIVGRFFCEAMSRSRKYYGPTNERVIIISGVFSPTVKKPAGANTHRRLTFGGGVGDRHRHVRP
jgi:hypothetical protein